MGRGSVEWGGTVQLITSGVRAWGCNASQAPPKGGVRMHTPPQPAAAMHAPHQPAAAMHTCTIARTTGVCSALITPPAATAAVNPMLTGAEPYATHSIVPGIIPALYNAHLALLLLHTQFYATAMLLAVALNYIP